MRSAPSNVDWLKLESFDRKYKGMKGEWRTGDRLGGEKL